MERIKQTKEAIKKPIEVISDINNNIPPLGVVIHELSHLLYILTHDVLPNEIEKMPHFWKTEMIASFAGLLHDILNFRDRPHKRIWGIYVSLINVIIYGTLLGIPISRLEDIIKKIINRISK